MNDELAGAEELRARAAEARSADRQRMAREADRKTSRRAEVAELLESFLRRAMQLDVAPTQLHGESSRIRHTPEGEDWQITHETIAIPAFRLFSGYWSETANKLHGNDFFPHSTSSTYETGGYWISGPPYSMEVVAHEARWRRPSRRQQREIARDPRRHLINGRVVETRARAPRAVALTRRMVIEPGRVERGRGAWDDTVTLLDSVPLGEQWNPARGEFELVDLSLLRQLLEETLVLSVD